MSRSRRSTKTRKKTIAGWTKAARRLRDIEPADNQLPPNWDDLEFLYRFVRNRKPGCCIEFGSGWSTLAIGLALASNEQGKLLSFDGLETWAGWVRDRTSDLGLKYWVNVNQAPVYEAEYHGIKGWRYSGIYTAAFDFIYLDGPPLTGERQVCFEPVLMEPTLAKNWTMVVDGRVQNVEYLKRMDAVVMSDQDRSVFFG